MKRLSRLAIVLMLIVAVLAGCAPASPAITDAPAIVTAEPTAPPTTSAAQPEATAPGEATTEPAATEAATAAVTTEGGVITRALTSEPPNLDPQGAPHSGLSLLLPYLYDTLVVRDLDNQVLPGLAESWEVAPDGLAITMTLKSGVTFHDGTPLNAEAIKFTFERFKEVGKASPIYGGVRRIAGIDTPDDQTVVFAFKTPAANFFSTISMPYAGIISPASAAKVTESGSGNLVGSGPFMLKEWKAGQSITLERNPAYNWGPPVVENRAATHIEQQVFKLIPEASTQLAALEAEEVDIMFVNNPGHRRKLAGNSDVTLHEAVLNSLVYLGFNAQKAPFDQPAVRRALSHAIDKEEIVMVALGGVGQVADAPLPPTLPGYDPALKEYALPYAPDKAQELLRGAGFMKGADGIWAKDGQPLKAVLLGSTRAPNETIATLIQSQLGKVGVDVEIQLLDSKAVMQATTEGNFDLLLWRYDWNDPDALNIYLGSDRIGSTNRVGYSNPTVDELLKQGAAEMDEAERVKLYVEAQKLILADAAWQPLYYPVDVIATGKRLQGAEVGYMGRLLLNDATVAP